MEADKKRWMLLTNSPYKDKLPKPDFPESITRAGTRAQNLIRPIWATAWRMISRYACPPL